MFTLPKLKIFVGADTKEAEKGLKGTGDAVDKLGKKSKEASVDVTKLAGRLKTGLAVAAAAAAYGLMSSVKASASLIDSQAKLAQTLNTSVKSIQIMARAGELAGVEMSGIEQATKDLERRLSQAAAGSGPVADALRRIGLSAEFLLKQDLDKRVDLINNAIKKFIPVAQQAAVAGQLFGEEGSLAMSRIDTATIRQATRDIEDFGVAVTDAQADAVEDMNDALSRLGLAMTATSNKILVSLTPAIKGLTDLLIAFADETSEVAKEARGLAKDSGEVTLAANDEKKAVEELSRVLGTAKTMTVETAKQKLKEAISRRENIEAMKEEARQAAYTQVFGAGSDASALLSRQVQLLRAVAAAQAQGFKGYDLKNLQSQLAAVNAEIRAVNDAIYTGLDEAFGESLQQNEQNILRLEEALKRAKEGVIDLGNASEEEKKKSAEAAKERAKEAKDWENSVRDVLDAMDELRGMPPVINEVREEFTRLGEVGRTAEYAFEDMFMSIADGTMSAKDAFKQFAAEVIRELYRVLVVQQLVGQFSMMGKGNGIMGLIGNVFGSAGGSLGSYGPVTTAPFPTSFSLPNFAGGGDTGLGSRFGGVDGRGGFPAILHPNETVIDHDALGGGQSGGMVGGVVVNQTINVSTGVQATVRNEIMGLMPQISESAKMAVLEARQRGGTFAGAFR